MVGSDRTRSAAWRKRGDRRARSYKAGPPNRRDTCGPAAVARGARALLFPMLPVEIQNDHGTTRPPPGHRNRAAASPTATAADHSHPGGRSSDPQLVAQGSWKDGATIRPRTVRPDFQSVVDGSPLAGGVRPRVGEERRVRIHGIARLCAELAGAGVVAGSC